MSRLNVVNPSTATGRSGELLQAVKAKLGLIPNMTRAMAESPAVLASYLAFTESLGTGKLAPRLRELIALAVAESNGCDYCLSAHSAIGGLLKIPQADIEAARSADSADDRTRAALRFARAVIDARGHVSDDELAGVRKAGWSDAEIGEIVATVALNVFTNLFNSVAATEIDFPRVTSGLRKAA